MTSESEKFGALREKDHVVLAAIREGHTDVRALSKNLTYSTREINYSLTNKLEPLGLITLNRPGPNEYREEVDDGRRRTFREPKHAELTEQALHYFASTDRDDDLDPHTNLSHSELVHSVRDLEQRVEALEDRLTKALSAIQKQLRENHER